MKALFPELQPSQRKAAAFSLVEVMVAVGLLAFIIVGLLAMFYQTQRAFRSSATQTDVLEAGRAAMQIIRQDIQEMHAAGHPLVTNFLMLPARGSTTLAFPLPPKTGTNDLKTELLDLTFLQKISDEWVGVAYRIEGAGAGLGTLKRMEERHRLDSLDPFTDTQVAPEQYGLITLGTYWDGLPAGDAGFHRVIDGVVHFDLIPYDTNGVPLSITNVFTTNFVPAYVDVELGILEPKTLEQVRARLNALNTNAARIYLKDRVERVHMFKQRIPIRTRS
jgi:type II secretory pathway pseudopilin PulG